MGGHEFEVKVVDGGVVDGGDVSDGPPAKERLPV
jgi:hypothetical protein